MNRAQRRLAAKGKNRVNEYSKIFKQVEIESGAKATQDAINKYSVALTKVLRERGMSDDHIKDILDDILLEFQSMNNMEAKKLKREFERDLNSEGGGYDA